jgi:hypothetical protein
LNKGEWVGHPPGYPLFFALAHFLMACSFKAVYAQQSLSATAYLLSIPVLFALLQRFTESKRALLLTAAFTFSWIPFNIATSGTTHSSDLLFSGLFLLIVTSPGFRSGRISSFSLLFASLLLCGANRFTTVLMFVPLWLLLSLEHFRRPSWWVGWTVFGLGQTGLFLLITHLSGGWDAYREKVAVLREINGASSLLLSGLNPSTVLNFSRTFFWILVAALPLPLLILPWFLRKKPTLKECLSASYETKVAAASLAGCLGLCSLYVCVHIGYLAPALPPLYLLMALVLNSKVLSQRTESAIIASSLILSFGLFYLMMPVQHPKNVKEAAANALLLQYSKQGLENPGWKSLSRWLLDEGLIEDVPEYRRDASR